MDCYVHASAGCPLSINRHTKKGGGERRFKTNNQKREEFVYSNCIVIYEVSAI